VVLILVSVLGSGIVPKPKLWYWAIRAQCEQKPRPMHRSWDL